MRISNTADMFNPTKENRPKIIKDLQDFLNYKRTNTKDFGNRLLKDFNVVDFSGTQEENKLFVQFENYEKSPQSNHYWVEKKELDDFLNGNRPLGVNLLVDKFSNENDCLILEVNLMKNGFKKTTIQDAERLKGININYGGKLYKSYDVQVNVETDNIIDKIIRIFVFEPSSAESYIEKNTVVQNKVEIKNGITFEDFYNQDRFVRKFDALEAVRMERKSISNELRAWFMLNMADKVTGEFSEAFLKKIKEII